MKIKNLSILLFLLIVSFFIFTACGKEEVKKASEPVKVSAEENNVHPEEMGNQDCLACHVDVTPDVVDQWKHSAHGFINVRCQVCHGDEKNFSKIPSDETCRGCHSNQYDNKNVKDPNIRCTTCHTVHNFNVHNVKQYNYK